MKNYIFKKHLKAKKIYMYIKMTQSTSPVVKRVFSVLEELRDDARDHLLALLLLLRVLHEVDEPGALAHVREDALDEGQDVEMLNLLESGSWPRTRQQQDVEEIILRQRLVLDFWNEDLIDLPFFS